MTPRPDDFPISKRFGRATPYYFKTATVFSGNETLKSRDFIIRVASALQSHERFAGLVLGGGGHDARTGRRRLCGQVAVYRTRKVVVTGGGERGTGGFTKWRPGNQIGYMVPLPAVAVDERFCGRRPAATPSEGLKLMNGINPYRHRYLYASGDFPQRGVQRLAAAPASPIYSRHPVESDKSICH